VPHLQRWRRGLQIGDKSEGQAVPYGLGKSNVSGLDLATILDDRRDQRSFEIESLLRFMEVAHAYDKTTTPTILLKMWCGDLTLFFHRKVGETIQ